ncbi:MAG TPA: alpha-galactosidase [Steroidobacteraceae bacterium]|nr:alpha-galactosidase [Steroidobacteraceae bacterium]
MSKNYIPASEPGKARRAGPAAGLFIGSLLAMGIGGAQASPLSAAVNARGVYSIGEPAGTHPTIVSAVAAEVDGRWVRTTDYPHCVVRSSQTRGYLGQATQWQVACSGLQGQPNLTYRLRVYATRPFADLRASVVNSSGKPINVESMRLVAASGGEVVSLGASVAADRVLFDSFSEDRPAMRIHDFGRIDHGMARAVGSQLIYNRDSHASLFIGALTSERFLTVLRLRLAAAGGVRSIAGYQVDSTGTTELEEENSLADSPAEDRITLSLPVAPGQSLNSETLVLSVSHDYHDQLQTYAHLVRQIHHARVDAPPLMGWWSWTAYYFGLDAGAALTNAAWEAQHLKSYGYDLFHIDEGYQFARGEYTTPDATLFPEGMSPLEYAVRGLGLTPGIWTAPFEVSERSWVYRQHPDWLVKNAHGQPIHAGNVVDGKDQLYILDSTNPGAQAYLRTTYRTLVRQWDIHYIKLDFMDDSAIEGYYYKPHTTAMEAQRIGLSVIRDAVGDGVYLDKDGSVMLNPVGYVDYGRISQDTGHAFEASRDAATGIAARYYMDRNYFVSDPDAFTVSRQRITDQTWHEGKQALTLDEAQVSIALAAVSGGMLEIGDNLTSLEGSPRRLALIENRDLIDMVRLGKASIPEDLMSYSSADGQPSVFFLPESARQSILTVFNWTERPAQHVIKLSDLGLRAADSYDLTDVLSSQAAVQATAGSVRLELPPHSVRVLKIIDDAVPASLPGFDIRCPASGPTGAALVCSAKVQGTEPVLTYDWTFGDGVSAQGSRVAHTWTEPGEYHVVVLATALDGKTAQKEVDVRTTGYMSSVFAPSSIRRLGPPR